MRLHQSPDSDRAQRGRNGRGGRRRLGACCPAGPSASGPDPALLGHRLVGVPWSLGRETAEWRQDTKAGGWLGRVVYAVDDGAATVIVEAWVPARHLQPAG